MCVQDDLAHPCQPQPSPRPPFLTSASGLPARPLSMLCRLLALAVGSGPSGTTLDFRHASRGNPATIDELGRVVLNACQVCTRWLVEPHKADCIWACKQPTCRL